MAESPPASRPPQEEQSPELSLVIPVRDEEGNVEPVVTEALAVLAGQVHLEVIVVDDGSRDRTVDRLRELAASSRGVRFEVHPRPLGKTAAIWTGVRAARASWIATMDGDGQNDPADIARMRLIAAREPPCDRGLLVAGERIARHDGWSKRRASIVANRVRELLLADGVGDSACGLKLFRRDDFLALPRFEGMHRFLPALVLDRGGRVITTPVADRPRRSGASKYGILDRLAAGIRDLARVVWLRRRRYRSP